MFVTSPATTAAAAFSTNATTRTLRIKAFKRDTIEQMFKAGKSTSIGMTGTSTSTGKTLSKGTLGLQFMQRSRLKQQQEKEEEVRAQTEDDAKWEVPASVREKWGVVPGLSSVCVLSNFLL